MRVKFLIILNNYINIYTILIYKNFNKISGIYILNYLI